MSTLFPGDVEDVAGQPHHVGALAEKQVVAHVLGEQRVVHAVDGVGKVADVKIHGGVMQPFHRETRHQRVDVLLAVEVEQRAGG